MCILVALAIVNNVEVSKENQAYNSIIEDSSKENSQEESAVDKNNNVLNDENLTAKEKNQIWKIEIPAINLEAEIAEGTDSIILNSYVGHFEDTDFKERKYRISSSQ